VGSEIYKPEHLAEAIQSCEFGQGGVAAEETLESFELSKKVNCHY